MRQTKIVLSDKEIPTKWYNIMADMPNKPKPPLHPGTKQPIGPRRPQADLSHGPHPPGSEPGALDRYS